MLKSNARNAQKNKTLNRRKEMKTFCSYEDGVGILFGDIVILSDDIVKDQFGQDGCDWFLTNVNKTADDCDLTDDFCYVSEEYHGEVLYAVMTRDARFIIDAFDTPQEATELKNKINDSFKEWGESNEVCNRNGTL